MLCIEQKVTRILCTNACFIIAPTQLSGLQDKNKMLWIKKNPKAEWSLLFFTLFTTCYKKVQNFKNIWFWSYQASEITQNKKHEALNSVYTLVDQKTLFVGMNKKQLHVQCPSLEEQCHVLNLCFTPSCLTDILAFDLHVHVLSENRHAGVTHIVKSEFIFEV